MSIVPQLIMNSLIAAGTYALVALGFNLIYGATKFFNLAHGVMAAVGGYTVLFMMDHVPQLPLVFSILIGVGVAALVGAFLNRVVYSPLRTRKASTMILLVASLGTFTVIQALLAIGFTSQFHSLAIVTSEHVHTIMGASVTETQLLIILCALAVFLALHLVLRKTLFGKEVRAISDDEEVAKITGINTEKVLNKVFFIGSGIAGLAGAFIGFDTGIQPTMGLDLLLKGVIAAIVGGIGSVSGAMLGALFLGFAENFGIWKISGEWKDAIAFGCLIIFLIFRPQGIIKK